MWGKVPSPDRMSQQRGITPAYAGKSRVPPFRVPRRQDHPRLCGEKGNIDMQSQKKDRITPAYAGKRPLERPPTTATKDHPRLCGEKRSGGSMLSFVRGSPPPMRGKVRLYCLRISRQRITPAYAGKSDVVHRSTRDI